MAEAWAILGAMVCFGFGAGLGAVFGMRIWPQRLSLTLVMPEGWRAVNVTEFPDGSSRECEDENG